LTFIWIVDEQAMVHNDPMKMQTSSTIGMCLKDPDPRNPVKSGAQLFDGCSFVVMEALS